MNDDTRELLGTVEKRNCPLRYTQLRMHSRAPDSGTAMWELHPTGYRQREHIFYDPENSSRGGSGCHRLFRDDDSDGILLV